MADWFSVMPGRSAVLKECLGDMRGHDNLVAESQSKPLPLDHV